MTVTTPNDAPDPLREEVLALSSVLATSLTKQAGPLRARLLTALTDAVGRASMAEEEAAEFVARMTVAEATPDERAAANKAAFLWLSLNSSSAIAACLVESAHLAFRSIAGATAPFVEVEDLHELVRWRVWSLPAERFTPSGILQRPTAYLRVLARNLAIDQLRRLGPAETWPVALAEAPEQPGPTGVPLDEKELLAKVRRVIGAETPDWLVEPCLDALLGRRERAQILAEVNALRAREGQQAWTANALNVFLHRLRSKVRAALREE